MTLANSVTVDPSQVQLGVSYTITLLGTTDFTKMGAKTNATGVTFIANAAGLERAMHV